MSPTGPTLSRLWVISKSLHNTWYLRAQKDEKALLSSIKVPVEILNLLQGEDFIFLDFPALFDFAPI